MASARKLYVGNLAFETTERELRRHFEEFGKLEEVRVITDRESGRSRGYGFVTFEENEDGERAMDELNNSDLDGRAIKVNIAQDRDRDRRGGGGGYRGGGGGYNRDYGGGYRDNRGYDRGGYRDRSRERDGYDKKYSGGGRSYGRDSGRDRKYESY